LASIFFVDPGTTIQGQIFYHYHTALLYYSLHIHPNLLAKYTFLDPKQSDQTHQDLDPEGIFFHTIKKQEEKKSFLYKISRAL
jgi:hypothetical protein